MKLECTQCGAVIAVTSPDAYVNCTYCGAKAVISGFRGQSFLHRPVLNEEDAVRLFPPGGIASISIYWFPYDPDSMERVFTQPYAEMVAYSPPSGDRRVWDEGEVSGTVIPVDPDLAGDQGVLFHPVWVAINGITGQGTLVDAVSGRMIGESPGRDGSGSIKPVEESIKAFATGVVPALIIFFLLRGLSLFWASVLGMAGAIFAPDLWQRLRRGGK